MILIVDFGSQYIQLIARRIRESKVYCEVYPFHKITEQLIEEFSPRGIILSGGPASVNDENAPKIPDWIFNLRVPILGICYGFQYMAHFFGGIVKKSDNREYGKAHLINIEDCILLNGACDFGCNQIWMSHGDVMTLCPKDFKIAGWSNRHPAVIINEKRKLYALQFHPEVAHTQDGVKILNNFIYKICGCLSDWTMRSFQDDAIAKIQNQVGDGSVISAISGGVDSSVSSTLIHKAIGNQITCVFVDNGLTRLGEVEQVEKSLRSLGMKLIIKDASDLFLKRLKGVVDPEKKRKVIGVTFIEVFKTVADGIGGAKFLGQGTLYPDVIESVTVFGGGTAPIKSHHNVGGLPAHMDMELVEPLRMLFKDEVRILGKELGIPDDILGRWPFPGPGLAIRIFSQEVTPYKLELCRKADAIFTQEVRKAGLYNKIWQGFAGIPPGRTVGVMGDERTYDYTFALRAVISTDGMTADAFEFPQGFINSVVTKIINEVPGLNRGYYDYTSKPPGTIEWE